MAKIESKKVFCACCKNKVDVQKVISYASDKIGLDGNLHNPLQYKLQECPSCHYASVDISDTTTKVSQGMLNAFHMKPVYARIEDSCFKNMLKASDVYEKNKNYYAQAYMLRLASFWAAEKEETSVSRNLMRAANAVLEKHFTELETLSLSDIEDAVVLIDCNRKLGMLKIAEDMCDDLLDLLAEADVDIKVATVQKILYYEKQLIAKRDLNEHLTSEVL